MSTNSLYKKNTLTSRNSTKNEVNIGEIQSFNQKKKNKFNQVQMANTLLKEYSIYADQRNDGSEGHKLSYNYKFTSPVRLSDKNAGNIAVYETPCQVTQSAEVSKNKKLSTPSTRKYSDNCDSMDETKSVSSINTNCKTPKNAKKGSIDNNFKVKYKTEICKYWDLSGTCKFGENVRLNFLTLVCFCSRDHWYQAQTSHCK
jgi:hypothetical protein